MGLHRVGHDWSDLAAAWYFFVNSLSFLCNCPLAFLLSFILFLFTVLRVAFMFYESEVAQPCPTLCDPLDCSLPGFSVHGILQARKLEWVAIPFSRGSSLTQGSKVRLLHLLHWQVDSLPKRHLGRPKFPRVSPSPVPYLDRELKADESLQRRPRHGFL